MWFVWGTIISCLAILYSVFATLYLCTRNGYYLGTANSCFVIAMFGNLAWTICGSVFRYKHHGKVCSGDYFDTELYRRTPPFQWKSGRFIYVYLCILWMFWIVVFVFLCSWYFYAVL